MPTCSRLSTCLGQSRHLSRKWRDGFIHSSQQHRREVLSPSSGQEKVRLVCDGALPLDDGFVVQLPGRGLHDGKLLPCHLVQCRVLHRGGDGADELWEDPVRGQEGEGAHGIHGRLPDKHRQSVCAKAGTGKVSHLA